MQQLDVKLICPGHGLPVGKDLLEKQKRYFVELRRQVRAGVDAGKGLDDIVPSITMPWYREWTGVEARDWTEIGSYALSNSITDERGRLWLATGLTHGAATPDPTEDLDVRWIPFEEALAMTADGRISDAVSIMGIQRVALRRAGVP